MFNLKRIILYFLAASTLTNAQFADKETRKILELKDKRELGPNNQLLDYLNNDSEENLILSLNALANISDTNTAKFIIENYNNWKSNKIKQQAIFSLAQINSGNAKNFLLNLLESSETQPVITSALNEIGKIGDEETLDILLNKTFQDDKLNAALCLSIARFGLRKIKNEKAVTVLKSLTSTNNDETLKYIAYAFNRIADKDLLSNARDEILSLAKSVLPETRMWAFLALGKLQDTSFLDYLSNAYDTEQDWRVKVNILYAVSNITTKNESLTNQKTFYILKKPFSSAGGVHEKVTSLQGIAKYFSVNTPDSSLLSEIEKFLTDLLLNKNAQEHWVVISEAANTLAKLTKDKASDVLFSSLYNTEDFNLKADIIHTFSNFENGLIYKVLRDSISSEIQRYNQKFPNKTGDLIGDKNLAKIYRAFVDVLYSLGEKVGEEDRNIFRLIFSEFLTSRDIYIVNTCLNGLMDSLYLPYRNESEQIIMFDFAELQYPRDLDLIVLYTQAIGELRIKSAVDLLSKYIHSENYDIALESAIALNKITGKNYKDGITAKKYRMDFDWAFLENMKSYKNAVIHTSKGNITIELFPESAPFTVQNFIKLSQKNYFDNTIFHRVVPNFVIQGGDPTSTGFGGPGYSIRSEFTTIPYETGYVGMASSGKDTEGSQFFITHSPQPHLDGKYTIFGKVVDGIDVVNQIQRGDSILKITFNN